MAQERREPRTDHLPAETVARVRMTVSCTDTDDIPKVADAGSFTTRDGVDVQVMHNGLVVEAGGYFGDWMAEIIRCLHGHHEPQEEVVFDAIVGRLRDEAPTAPAIVELGSFWAYYAMWFCTSLPMGRALMMEPDLANLELGRRNFALNQLTDRATFIHGVIGPEPGEMTEFDGMDGIRYPTPQFDLHSLMEQGGLDYADVVLSDIQGAESILIERARGDFAAGRVRFLIVSTHHHSISGSALTHQNALAAFRDAGAHVIGEHSVAESYSGDGLIAVSFDPRDKDFSISLGHARARESLFGELEWDLQAATHRGDLLEQQVAELRGLLAAAQSAPPVHRSLARAAAGRARGAARRLIR